MSSYACPECSGATAVRDSRPRGEGGIRRRRSCVSCGARFTTFEVLSGAAEKAFSELDRANPLVMRQVNEIVSLMPGLTPDDRMLLVALAHRMEGSPSRSKAIAAMASTAPRPELDA